MTELLASGPEHDRNGPADLVLDVVLFAPVGVMCCFPALAAEVFADPAHVFTHASDEGRRVIRATERRVEDRIRQQSEQVHRALEGLGLTWSVPSWLPTVPGSSGSGRSGSSRSAPGPIESASTTFVPDVPVFDPTPKAESGVSLHGVALDPDGRALDEPAVVEAALGITDYASLSASQVMPRLEGLTPDELEVLRQFELQNRGRKTILNKIAQLQQPASSDA